MRIGEVAARAGVHVQTVRFYERRGLLKKPPRLSSGYRDYPAEAVRVVRFVKQSQALGFTLNEIKALIRLRDHRPGNSTQVRAALQTKLRSIDERIHLLQTMRDELDLILRTCKCGDKDLSCPLVEALGVSAAAR